MLGASLGALVGAGVKAAVDDPAIRSSPRAVATTQTSRTAVRTGGSRTIRIDDRHDVWVKHLGSDALPMLTLHGGPGWNHFYFECFEDFLPAAGLSFYYYDQLGCGFSDVPDDQSLWTMDRYISEVEQVRRGIGLDKMLLYGHSWGSMLAMEYAVRYPGRIEALVISNMTASIASYREYSAQIIATLPGSDQAIVTHAREVGKYDSAEYQAVVQKVYDQTLCRIHPWPEPILRSERLANQTIYNVMCGPDDLNIVGNLKDWDMWGRLSRIRAPTLLIAGRYDEMAPEQMRRMSALIPHSQLVVCSNGGHFAMYDDQRAYFDALIPFMKAHAPITT
jgi:proline iminopeptidase